MTGRSAPKLVIVAVAALLVACSPPPETAATPPADPPGRGLASIPAPDEEVSSPTTARGGPPAAAPTAGDSEPPVAGDQRRAPGTSEEAALYPAPGEYVYRQDGYEEFCRAGSCDQQDLPRTQPIQVGLTERRPGEATVVTDARVSDSRSVRTTIEHSRSGARITRVVARFRYGSFTFENTYAPRPAAEALRLPLKVGDRWSGSWSAQTSGDYEFAVAAYEKLRAGGRLVDVFRLNTHTVFRGEFEGEADIVTWVDPQRLAVVKTVGAVELRSAFGQFRSRFTTLLRRAPGWS
ncbi:MAG: hypothetical protein ABR505_06770 [Actinomycetota bacterium]